MAFEEERAQLRRYLNREWNRPGKPALVERWELGLDAGYEELALARPLLSLRRLKYLVDGHAHAQGVLRKNSRGTPELCVLHLGVKGRFPHGAVAVATEGSLLIDVALPPEHRRELFLLVPEALVEKPATKAEKRVTHARGKKLRKYP
jgi:hypothetical protein